MLVLLVCFGAFGLCRPFVWEPRVVGLCGSVYACCMFLKALPQPGAWSRPGRRRGRKRHEMLATLMMLVPRAPSIIYHHCMANLGCVGFRIEGTRAASPLFGSVQRASCSFLRPVWDFWDYTFWRRPFLAIQRSLLVPKFFFPGASALELAPWEAFVVDSSSLDSMSFCQIMDVEPGHQ